METSPIKAFQMTAISRALRMYAKTGMKMNRAYTPSAMLRTAEALTGLKFKRGEYERAAQALDLASETTLLAGRIKAEHPAITDAQLLDAVRAVQQGERVEVVSVG